MEIRWHALFRRLRFLLSGRRGFVRSAAEHAKLPGGRHRGSHRRRLFRRTALPVRRKRLFQFRWRRLRSVAGHPAEIRHHRARPPRVLRPEALVDGGRLHRQVPQESLRDRRRRHPRRPGPGALPPLRTGGPLQLEAPGATRHGLVRAVQPAVAPQAQGAVLRTRQRFLPLHEKTRHGPAPPRPAVFLRLVKRETERIKKAGGKQRFYVCNIL
mmetsp:Transcript_22683/g.48132  ORF Transcript_22683/g.48132 Transcript_22683/m.48132 type:complete len:213 (-) Transcript_22683:487-1125(-)